MSYVDGASPTACRLAVTAENSVNPGNSDSGVAKNGHQLCVDLKDKSKNGNRDFAQLLDFIETDPFIMWAWDPGTRAKGKARTTPPLATHDQFLSTVKQWIADGAPCPAE